MASAHASLLLVMASAVAALSRPGESGVNFRPPSVPLIVQDPFVSIWSPATNLTDAWPQHWVGAVEGMSGMVLIGKNCYRWMGPASIPSCPKAMQQLGPAIVMATTTVYQFEAEGMVLTARFQTPALLDHLDLLSLPVSFLDLEVESTGAEAKDVKVYFDVTGQAAVSSEAENVAWNQYTVPSGDQDSDLLALRIGSEAQEFNSAGGSDQINWGYFYAVAEKEDADKTVQMNATVNSNVLCRTAFAQGQDLPEFDTTGPRPCNDSTPVLAFEFDMGSINPADTRKARMALGYDLVVGMQYFGEQLSPLFRKGDVNGGSSSSLMISIMADALKNDTIPSLCNEFDAKFYNTLKAKAGEKYALLGSLAYRQVTGAMTVVWNDKLQTHWMFMKEISSDGDVSTVDVIYPASPFLMWLSPETLRKLMMPLMVYANNETDAYGAPIYYNLPWAPHHLGHWPICDLAPEQQEQMPVEETGNMFVMLAYVAKAQQDVAYLSPYWAVMDTWGDFLVQSLPDPGNQLCTDDFEGPSPHNVNLAAKGIVGMAAYAQLLEMNGTDVAKEKAKYYRETAKNYSEIWMERADAGDHYKLQYDLNSTTFSLKYNLIWDQILGLDVYPDDVFVKEAKYYQSKMNTYGVPLDTRAEFTKTDWEMWVAVMGSEEQFQRITDAVFKFADETPTRIPFSDWYQTDTSEAVNDKDGFRARPVIGGIFAKMLTE